MDDHKKYKELHTYGYKELRRTVGLIGMLLPFVLMLGDLWLCKTETIRPSVSHYFYSDLTGVFVGSLCAVALFLFFYAGYDIWENVISSVAACGAIGAAWAPYTEIPALKSSTGTAHFIFAAIFFVCLMLLAFPFMKSNKPKERLGKRKLSRNRIYLLCALIMFCCLIAIIAYKKSGGQDAYSPFIYWAEAVALIAFGLSWLVKGATLFLDK